MYSSPPNLAHSIVNDRKLLLILNPALSNKPSVIIVAPKLPISNIPSTILHSPFL